MEYPEFQTGIKWSNGKRPWFPCDVKHRKQDCPQANKLLVEYPLVNWTLCQRVPHVIRSVVYLKSSALEFIPTTAWEDWGLGCLICNTNLFWLKVCVCWVCLADWSKPYTLLWAHWSPLPMEFVPIYCQRHRESKAVSWPRKQHKENDQKRDENQKISNHSNLG